jgi:hypothetical protein
MSTDSGENCVRPVTPVPAEDENGVVTPMS